MTSEKMTPEKLRAIYGETSPRAAAKVISSFDTHCQQFIANATFLIIATSNGADLDISPKGDPAGFVEVESPNTLLIPDRPGNNRLDGLMNILACPIVALLFMIPAVSETLRVNGTAEISDEPALCERFQVKGRMPKTVLRVTASEIYTHCGKAPVRAGLWKPDSWPAARPIPTLYEILQDHTHIQADITDQEAVEKHYQDSLY